MTLDEALARPAAADEIVTITCHIVVRGNDEIILTASEESFYGEGQRIQVRNGEWIIKRMSSLPPLVGGSLRHFYACEITGRLRRNHGTPEFADVSRCVIRGEELDESFNDVPFELIFNRNEPAP